MTFRVRWLAWALVLLPAAAPAQTLTGAAEWVVGRGGSATNGQTQDTNSFWQSYTIGFSSALVNPRLLKYGTEVSFRTNGLSFGSADAGGTAHQRDLGYRLGATLFPAGHFTANVMAVRDNISESGDYPSSSGIRGGIVVPPGAPSPDFLTRDSSISGGMRLDFGALPRIDFGYRKGASVVTTGPYRAEQREEDLHLNVSKDTAGTRQTLRYQRTSFQNPISQMFNQRMNNLGYEFDATLSAHSRATARIGRRSDYSLFDVPTQSVDPGVGAYHPPTRGAVDSLYAICTAAYEPNGRMSIAAAGSVDRQTSAGSTTDAKLASASARVEAFRGLTFNASGIYGSRGQIVGAVPINVLTRSGQAGAVFRTGVRWLEGNVAYNVGIGANTTPEGHVGETSTWNGQAGLSISSKRFGLFGNYQRSRSRDRILDYGNYDVERYSTSAQSQVGRLLVNGSWEQSFIARGRGTTFSADLQRTFTGSVSVPVQHDTLISANAGGFTSRGDFRADRALFAGVGLESQLRKGLRLSAWIRRGNTAATLTHLDQRTLYVFGQIEYLLRQFRLAIEYRHNDQDLRSADLSAPVQFHGHLFLVRISRKSGFHV